MDEQLRQTLNSYTLNALASMDRVMVFIDAGYLQACLRAQFSGRAVDLTRFASHLAQGHRLIRTYYYTARIENPPDPYWKQQQSQQQSYLAALAHEPFLEVRLGRLQFGDGAPRQKGVDVMLALDMHRFALKNNYDLAVLVSGDGDFADIVRMVKDEGRRVEIVTFPGTRARALLEAADRGVEVDETFLGGCWREIGQNKSST